MRSFLPTPRRMAYMEFSFMCRLAYVDLQFIPNSAISDQPMLLCQCLLKSTVRKCLVTFAWLDSPTPHILFTFCCVLALSLTRSSRLGGRTYPPNRKHPAETLSDPLYNRNTVSNVRHEFPVHVAAVKIDSIPYASESRQGYRYMFRSFPSCTSNAYYSVIFTVWIVQGCLIH